MEHLQRKGALLPILEHRFEGKNDDLVYNPSNPKKALFCRASTDACPDYLFSFKDHNKSSEGTFGMGVFFWDDSEKTLTRIPAKEVNRIVGSPRSNNNDSEEEAASKAGWSDKVLKLLEAGKTDEAMHVIKVEMPAAGVDASFIMSKLKAQARDVDPIAYADYDNDFLGGGEISVTDLFEFARVYGETKTKSGKPIVNVLGLGCKSTVRALRKASLTSVVPEKETPMSLDECIDESDLDAFAAHLDAQIAELEKDKDRLRREAGLLMSRLADMLKDDNHITRMYAMVWIYRENVYWAQVLHDRDAGINTNSSAFVQTLVGMISSDNEDIPYGQYCAAKLVFRMLQHDDIDAVKSIRLLLSETHRFQYGEMELDGFLYDAMRKGHVGFLLGHNVDPNKASTETGATPLCIAMQNVQVGVVRLLLGHKSSLGQVNLDRGSVALCMAAQNGHVVVVRLLLERKVDPNQASTEDGATPICMAAQNGHVDAVRVLMAHTADPYQARTTDGATAMFLAAENGHTDAVRVLLEHVDDLYDVDPNQARTTDGATPTSIAEQNGHVDVVRILMEHVVDENLDDDLYE